MPITRPTITLAAGARLRLNREVDAYTRTLAKRWGTAWAALAPEWEAAIAQLIDLRDDGRWPTRAQVLRADRVRAALGLTLDALQSLTDAAGGTINGRLPDIAADTATDQGRIIASQLPAIAGEQATLATRFSMLPTRTLPRIVERTAGQVTALHYPLAAEATAKMTAELIKGVALGSNPRQAAREMIRRTEGGFNGGLHRAENIARTEMLDVYRQTAAAIDEENSDVVASWVWLAKFDARTCPSCLAQHGSVHPITEPGPLDHQSGRCARMPKTKTWAELGYDVPGGEPADLIPDVRAQFAALDPAEQDARIGARRAELLRSGAVGWDDLTARRETPAWRPSYAPTPVRDLERIAAGA